jgi:O-antigen ligase
VSETLSLVQAAFLGLLALIAAVVLVAAVIGGATAIERFSPSLRLAALLATLLVGTTLSITLSGRQLYSEELLALRPVLLGDKGVGGTALSIRVSQLSTALVLVLALTEIFNAFFVQRWAQVIPKTVLSTAYIYFVLSVPLSAVAGTWRAPALNALYGPILVLAFALLAPRADARVWRYVAYVLLLVSAAALALAVFRPGLALETGYSHGVLGIDVRLHGLAGHANQMGMLSVVALAVTWGAPLGWKFKSLAAVSHLLVCLLAQSKTSWVALVVVVGMYGWWELRRRAYFRDDWSRVVALMAGGCALSAALLVAAAVVVDRRVLPDDRVIEGLLTLTGRTEIWAITFREFMQSPIFGYGPSIWDEVFRAERGLLHVGQAHNQFVHTLGQSGLLGLGALMIYLLTLWGHAASGEPASRLRARMLLLSLVIACAAETPLRFIGVMGVDAWLHWVALAAVLVARPTSSADRIEFKGVTSGVEAAG